jgi:hypothetical protein
VCESEIMKQESIETLEASHPMKPIQLSMTLLVHPSRQYPLHGAGSDPCRPAFGSRPIAGRKLRSCCNRRPQQATTSDASKQSTADFYAPSRAALMDLKFRMSLILFTASVSVSPCRRRSQNTSSTRPSDANGVEMSSRDVAIDATNIS